MKTTKLKGMAVIIFVSLITTLVIIENANSSECTGIGSCSCATHPCSHPGDDKCPNQEETRALHCVSCDSGCGDSHKEGTVCHMNWPCGKGDGISLNSYCTPTQNY